MKYKPYVIALIITLIILVVTAYVWYNFYGWKEFPQFEYGGDTPSWTAVGGTVADLRFKDVVFTIGTTPYDVTNQLNAMAKAYSGSSYTGDTLALSGPLNALSFTIPGVNDTNTLTSDTAAANYQTNNSSGTLTGKMRII